MKQTTTSKRRNADAQQHAQVRADQIARIRHSDEVYLSLSDALAYKISSDDAIAFVSTYTDCVHVTNAVRERRSKSVVCAYIAAARAERRRVVAHARQTRRTTQIKNATHAFRLTQRARRQSARQRRHLTLDAVEVARTRLHHVLATINVRMLSRAALVDALRDVDVALYVAAYAQHDERKHDDREFAVIIER